MQVLIANQEQVTELLPMDECIEVMTQALTMLAGGDAAAAAAHHAALAGRGKPHGADARLPGRDPGGRREGDRGLPHQSRQPV